ncbi:MAG: hypothetical protein GTN82_02185, partial [Candidatus Aminicenantes bacterium]|nr:hypothetical protein [Candidatus Aminicenantes bacterium]
TDPNVTEIKIGCIYPGLAYQFPYNYKFGLETEFHVVKQVDTTDEGIHFETPDEDDNVTAPEYHRYRMNFGDLKHQYFHEYCELIKPGKKVYILKFTEMECYYGIVPDQSLKKVTTRNEDTYSLRFFEDALGGTDD